MFFLLLFQKYQILFDDYLSFKGRYKFPQTISFVTPTQTLKLTIRGISTKEESWSTYTKRKAEEREQMSKIQNKEAFPPLLL